MHKDKPRTGETVHQSPVEALSLGSKEALGGCSHLGAYSTFTHSSYLRETCFLIILFFYFILFLLC